MMHGLITLAFATYLCAAVLQPDSDWQKKVAQHRKKPLPSPQQLATKFHRAEVAKKVAKKQHQAYLKSPEHHAEMVHAGNKIAERARHETPVPDSRHCGTRVPYSKSGYKNTDIVRNIFHL